MKRIINLLEQILGELEHICSRLGAALNVAAHHDEEPDENDL